MCEIKNVHEPSKNESAGQSQQVLPRDTDASHKDGCEYAVPLVRLLRLLSVAECPKSEKDYPVKTDHERQHLVALAILWQSLGRPETIFWQETYVFWNRIQDSYAENPNNSCH